MREENIIKQYRSYDEQFRFWISWQNIDEEKEQFIRYCISQGKKYQIRTLTVTDIEGYQE